MKKTALNSLLATIAITGGLAVTGLAAASGQAHAAEELSVQYDLYTRGMRAFALNYDARIEPAAYSARAKLRPKGLASLVVDLTLDMETAGTLTPKGAVPRSFTMGINENGKSGTYSVSFKGLKPASTKRNPGVDAQTAAKLDAESAKGVRDTLSSIMDMAVSAEANPCNGSHRVYNGKEVFQLSLAKLKDDVFHDKDGGVYRGPAIACRMVYSTLAGLSENTEAKYRKNPPTFNVWFAPVQSKSLGRPINVLIGVTGKIKGKDFVAYANRATINGKPLNAQSMASK
jgi:hypothetical protein